MVFSKLDALSIRPPTPPKDPHANGNGDGDNVQETLQFLDDPFGEKPLPPRLAAAKAVLNTPEQSPSDVSLSSPTSRSSSRRKKVNFELQTCALPNKAALTKNWTPTRSSPLRPLPQTRLTKPLKSILKPSDGTPTPPPTDAAAAAHKFKTFAEMLESIVKLLASPERPSRLDAYHSLQRTMQAYDKVPDDQALKQKMSLLAQFIRRDVQAQSSTGTGPDSQLISQALKLLMALFRIPDLISAMDDDFCSFIMDRIIAVASDGAMPKSVVNTHLAVCMQQNFRPKTMTVVRVEKILDALDTILDRVNGFSVQAYRIRIYRKLIQQRPETMIKHIERWFKLTVKALVASQKDINQSALDTCLAAAKTIGHDRHVARSVLTVLNRTRSDGKTLAKVMTQELDKMLSGDHAALAPQIWSAMTGLLRESLQSHLFPALKEWLKLFEKFFKSEKEAVRIQANVAFCFLIYAVNLASNTSSGWISMFLGIPLHQLQRRFPGKKIERDATTSGYITLLYYALRPTASFEQLDRYWTAFVANFWNPLVHSSSPQYPGVACQLVSALLNGSRKPWNEHRALDLRPQAMAVRAELPLLDPRWVRKSLALVLKFVETLLDVTPWSENDQQEEPLKTMWLAVLDALVEAGSKEIMASSETKDAIAHIVNLLRRVWDSHTAKLAVPQQKEDLWAKKFCFLVETVVQKLGASRFADKSLTRNSDSDLEVASTPTHRARHQGARTSPLLYFTDLLINQSEGKLSDTVRRRVMGLILKPCFDAQNARLARLELLRDCASTVDDALNAAVAESLWAQITEFLHASIKEPVIDLSERGSQSYGKEYEVIVELLGLGSTFLLSKSRGEEVLSTFINAVRREAGEGAVILAVIEPVSERVIRQTPDEDRTLCLSFLALLLKNLPRQMSRRVLDQGRQLLWPASPATGRVTDFDPYNHLYTAIVAVGTAAYRDLTREGAESTRVFIAALTTSIQHCSTSHLAVYLRKTQQVIATWVEDPEKKMQSADQSLKSLHRGVVNMWREINMAIVRLPRKDSQILFLLEPLITSGLLSRRRGIVNSSIATWNDTFGKEEHLQYPACLEQALRRLYSSVQLALPSLDLRKEDSKEQPAFYDSDISIEDTKSRFKSPRVKESPFRISKSARKSMSQSPAVPTPGSTRRVSARSTPKVRLLHNDSQIQFEPITSSPSNPFNQESQVLTDRQKEMVDRQRISTSLFANMAAILPTPDEVQSPMELHSDAPSADDYVNLPSRTTPPKALAAMGPMDMFLESSPTPHARKSIQHFESDATSSATPTAVRTVDLTTNNVLELSDLVFDEVDCCGSLPPHFDKIPSSTNGEQTSPDVQVGSSFDYRQPESLQSFDEGTTIDEEALLAAEREAARTPEAGVAEDSIMSELPSSAIDLQLNAQIDAELQAQEPNEDGSIDEIAQESMTGFVDDASHRPSFFVNDMAEDDAEDGTSGTSRIGDSFEKPTEKSTPRVEGLRRSSRHSAPSSSVAPLSSKKRRRTPGKKGKKGIAEGEMEEPSAELGSTQPDDDNDDDMLDNIVVASPKKPTTVPSSKKPARGKKRKLMSGLESPGNVVVPETIRKSGMIRRSQSLLSQVENSQDTLVEDTPAPKRARGSNSKDVSEAKRTPSPSKTTKEVHSLQSKRLSHVQVIPKRSSELGSSVRGTPITSVAAVPPEAKVTTVPDEEGPKAVETASPERASQPSATPSRSFTERVILTPRSIINQLKNLKAYLFSAPQLVLQRDEEREIDDALFDIRRQVLIAGLRVKDGPDGAGKE